ncbi:MAG: hypothetical protein EPN93_00585 [Spirochaetes bacterium]|nr:MAG: hypothetical protein EPN93_00585 [Spirochaetota bacterium]
MEAHGRNINPELLTAAKKGSEIVFISYATLSSTEDKIKFALLKLLEQFGKEELLTPVFSCIKELIANATKANAKHILVNEGVISDTDDVIAVVQKIRTILNEEALLAYGIKAKESRLTTRTYLRLHGDRLVVEVVNNLPLQKRELFRIHDRIEKSSKYDSIAEFYLENPDPAAEGMGLGLSMVVVLLKSINVNYRNFSVVTERGKTFARIVFPLATA